MYVVRGQTVVIAKPKTVDYGQVPNNVSYHHGSGIATKGMLACKLHISSLNIKEWNLGNKPGGQRALVFTPMVPGVEEEIVTGKQGEFFVFIEWLYAIQVATII